MDLGCRGTTTSRPDALVRILQRMRAEPKHASAFAETLPVAGRDGTLSKRLAGTAAEGRVRAKTGTVDNVRAIAGYVDTASGETLVFSIIANNFTVPTSTIDAAADRALVRLASFPGSPEGPYHASRALIASHTP